MANEITADGLTTQTQAELLGQLTADLQAIYGADINVASDTPDGQEINIIAQVALDNLDLATQIYNNFDPDKALGVVLDQRVSYNGIQRQAGTHTYTNITIVTTSSLTLYGLSNIDGNPAYTVADNAGNEFELVDDQSPSGAGTYVYVFRAKVAGAVLTTPNTITVPVTVVLGVSSINNPTTYTTLGINEESDAALKIRRQKSVSISSQGYLAGLLAVLENINGISAAFVYENNSGTTDDDGVPGHSIWVIVSGTAEDDLVAWSADVTYGVGNTVVSAGNAYSSVVSGNINHVVSDTDYWRLGGSQTDYPIAVAIYTKRNAGCGMFGSESFTITQIDGSPFTVYWDEVVPETLFIRFTTASLDGVNPPNIALIRSGLVSSFVPGVFEKVNVNDLATQVQVLDNNTLVTNAGFSSTASGAYTSTKTPATKNKQFSVIEADIIILPMILSPYNPESATPIVVEALHTEQFTGLGGYGTLTYDFVTNNSGGSINSSTGLYTAGVTPSTDTIRVTDSLSNTTIAVITVV